MKTTASSTRNLKGNFIRSLAIYTATCMMSIQIQYNYDNTFLFALLFQQSSTCHLSQARTRSKKKHPGTSKYAYYSS